MSVKRLLLAATAASLLVIGLVPLAHAEKIDAGVCIERHDRLGPQGRLRDTVERPEVDELQGWIAKHPRLAARAAYAAPTSAPGPRPSPEPERHRIDTGEALRHDLA